MTPPASRLICFLLLLDASSAVVLGTGRSAVEVKHVRVTPRPLGNVSGQTGRNVTLSAQSSKRNPVQAVTKVAESTIKTVSSHSVIDDVSGNLEEAQQTFIPGWHPPKRDIAHCSFVLIMASVWFAIYFQLLYRTDRGLSVLQMSQVEPPSPEAPPVQGTHFFFLFYHPECKREDDAEEVRISDLEQHYLFGEKAVKKYASDEERTRKAQEWFPNLAKLIAGAPNSETLAKGDVRIAVLKDVVHCLEKMHLRVHVYKSTDNEIVFVGAKLDDDAGESYILQDDLQLQLSWSVARDVLNVVQPPEEPASAPAYIRYDPGLAKGLDVQEVYDTTHASRVESGSLLCSGDCIRVIYKEFTSRFNLFIALQHGLMIDWFPLHHEARAFELQQSWAHFGKLWDFSFRQPVETMRSYFGSELTFCFLWIGTYCKALLAFVPLAVLHKTAVFVSFDVGMSQLAFSLVLVLWALLSSRLWDREEKFFFNAWNLSHEVSRVARSDFRGDLQPSPLDANMQTLQAWTFGCAVRRTISSLILGLFCFIVMTSVGYLEVLFPLNERSGTGFSTILAIQIKIFEMVYDRISKIFLYFENHEYAEGYCRSYFWKRFVFQCVNSYWPFMHIVLVRGFDPQQCPDEHCFGILREQLIETLLQLTAMRLFALAMSGAKVKATIAWVYAKSEGEDLDKAAQSEAEKQAIHGTFELLDQMDTLLELVGSLGYVILFGSVAPVAVPLCFIEFAVQLRATAVELMAWKRRPVPVEFMGLSACRNAVRFLISVGIVLTSILIVMHGKFFHDAPIISKLTGCLSFIIIASATRGILALAFDEQDPDTRLMIARRNYVKAKLYAKVRELTPAEQANELVVMTQRGIEERGEQGVEAVKRGDWAEIPRFQ